HKPKARMTARQLSEGWNDVLDALVLPPGSREQQPLGPTIVAAGRGLGIDARRPRVNPRDPLAREPDAPNQVITVLRAQAKDVIGSPQAEPRLREHRGRVHQSRLQRRAVTPSTKLLQAEAPRPLLHTMTRHDHRTRWPHTLQNGHHAAAGLM